MNWKNALRAWVWVRNERRSMISHAIVANKLWTMASSRPSPADTAPVGHELSADPRRPPGATRCLVEGPARAPAAPRDRLLSDRPHDGLRRGRPDAPGCESPKQSTRMPGPTPWASGPRGPVDPLAPVLRCVGRMSLGHLNTFCALSEGVHQNGGVTPFAAGDVAWRHPPNRYFTLNIRDQWFMPLISVRLVRPGTGCSE